jgi:hypothetical protein
MGKDREPDKKAAREQREHVIEVPTPTQDQKEYLEEIRRNTGRFDQNVVVGGPRRPST